MHEHRLAESLEYDIYQFNHDFSCFKFLCENRLLTNPAIHRCFSLARSVVADEKSIIWERLSPNGEGIINDENKLLKASFPDYKCNCLYRVSFWRKNINNYKIADLSSADLIGYLIIKHDDCPSLSTNHFYVFEAVFPKYAHPHNCSYGEKQYQVCFVNKIFEAKGVIFCQQNQIFKCCAHVALFSILSLHEKDEEISFATMNRIANIKIPYTGLNTQAIRKILKHYNVDFYDIDYDETEEYNNNIKNDIPYHKLAYAGIESGGGALIGFSLEKDNNGQVSRHMIPFFGHTFNKDTWVPHADASYFHFSSELMYIPSDSWTSSFIGHDDNFGANFCVPKLYIEKENVNYIVEIFRNGVKYSALQAEVYALQFLYSVINNVDIIDPDFWVAILNDAIRQKKITLRAISLTKDDYFNSLRKNDNFNDENIIDAIYNDWPNVLWMVEFSLPQLFPTNEAKLGEIIMNATEKLTPNQEYNNFLLARLPGAWIFCREENEIPQFSTLPSSVKSYMKNFSAN